MTARQQYFPGTEPPARNERIEIAIEHLYEAKQAQKEAADVTAVRMASLIEIAVEEGRDLYPFLEPETGRRKVLDVTAVRKARMKAAPSAKQEAADREFDAGSRAPAGPPLTMTVKVGDGPTVEVDPGKLARVGRRPRGEITGSVAAGRARKAGR